MPSNLIDLSKTLFTKPINLKKIRPLVTLRGLEHVQRTTANKHGDLISVCLRFQANTPRKTHGFRQQRRFSTMRRQRTSKWRLHRSESQISEPIITRSVRRGSLYWKRSLESTAVARLCVCVCVGEVSILIWPSTSISRCHATSQ